MRWGMIFSLLLLGGCAQPTPPATAPASLEMSWSQLAPIPHPLGVAGAFGGASGGALIVAGGANFPDRPPWSGGRKVYYDDLYVLSAPQTKWCSGFHLPRAIGYGVSISTDRGLICIGGCDASRCYSEACIVHWDGQNIAITPLPALPRPLANACGAAIGDVLYVAGGQTTIDATLASDRLWSLDLAASAPQWRELPACPGPPRTLAACAVFDGNFVLIGGVALSADPAGKPKRTYLRDVYSFSPATQSWKRLADLPMPIAASPTPAPVINRQILMLGGDDGSKVNVSPPEKHPGFAPQILAYDPHANGWHIAGQTPAPRATLPAVSWQGAIVLPSGEVRPAVRSPQVWRMRPAGMP